MEPQDVQHSVLWWHGPAFLKEPESTWPSLSAGKVIDLPEMKSLPALVAEDPPEVPLVNFEKYSKLISLQRIYAWVYRFVYNCNKPTIS